MEIGWANKRLRYPRELHVDTEELGERLKSIIVFCTDFFADFLLGSIDNRLTRKSGEGQEE